MEHSLRMAENELEVVVSVNYWIYNFITAKSGVSKHY